MTTYKLILGLTDVRDEESFIFDENHIENHIENQREVRDIRYNLFKQTPEIEKETLEWTFLTERPLVANLLKLWETVIRKPHLKMVNHHIFPHHYAPDENFNNLNVSFINLLPADNWVNFEEEDYDYVEQKSMPSFGAIYIDHGHLLIGDTGESINEVQITNLQYARNHDILEYLEPYVDRSATPCLDFNLGPYYSKTENFRIPDDMILWFKENKDELAALGYTVDNPRNKVGTYTIASMDTPAEKAHEIINKYNYVCRFSIVED